MAPSWNGDQSSDAGRLDAEARSFERAQERVGSVVCGKYRLERLLGVGSMAAVYAAKHLRNGGRVAIKILHGELSRNHDLCTRFLHEGYLANRIEHPAIVRVLDDGACEDGTLFLVMELVEGETFEARCSRKGGKLPVVEVVAFLDRLLDVLAAAHDKGIVHRDIKPENVFLTASGEIKLLDFGIAHEAAPSSARTVVGTVLGSPGFMAPEQALGRTAEVDALSDLWSVGAAAFTLLSGKLVHGGETANETLARAALMRAPAISTIAPHVPPALARVIDRALAFDKASRWPSARAMVVALRAPLESVPAPVPTSTRPVSPAPGGEMGAARVSRVSSVPAFVSAMEEDKWRRDLRRRKWPLLIPGVALGVGAIAAALTFPDTPIWWGSAAASGLVNVGDPAAPSEFSALIALPMLDAGAAAASVSPQGWALGTRAWMPTRIQPSQALHAAGATAPPSALVAAPEAGVDDESESNRSSGADADPAQGPETFPFDAGTSGTMNEAKHEAALAGDAGHYSETATW
jgi:serine/threonine-protein kinase